MGGVVDALYMAEKKAGGRSPAPALAAKSDRMPAETATVLVVEDEPELRDMAADLLEDLGYRTLLAATGETALALLRGDRNIDVIFTDLVMPGPIDGLRLAEEARRLCPDIRIVFTSGYAGHPALHNRLPGSDEILLHKPYRRGQLAAAIARALSS